MTELSSIIDDYTPANNDVGVALRSTVTVLFSTSMDEDRLEADFFLQGPDSDTYLGPGLLEQIKPDNISQGDMDDFLASPGYSGIVAGTITFTNIDPNNDDLETESTPYRTKLTFTPTNILAANTTYTAIIADTLDSDGNSYSNPVTFSFTTGSGSIEALPSNVSSSVLSQTQTAGGRSETTNVSTTAGTNIEVVKSTPADHSVENDPEKLLEIVIEMSKAVDATTVNTGNVKVKTYPVADHPNVAVTSSDPDELSTQFSVNDKWITIKV